ncbi:NYN domain-containing protein [Treponema sp. TIM-1]|uniref:NYN domain-containing protein n=1 Tax=Treponema sp. TIM-1 TaxID=2898417 RepID=UPI0039806D70
MAKVRINVYIDGFNLYHSTLQHTHPDCRWLNLLELSKRLINPETEEICRVYYFSALTTWIPERAKKHLLYIHALRAIGVKDVLGKFTLRERKCPLCAGRYQAHEEKKTDINIAITLLADAVADKFDTALILSGDSDLAPVTTKLRQLCPSKKIGIIVPQNQSAMNLKQHADFFKKIRTRDLKRSLLPEQVTYNDKVIIAPAGWLPTLNTEK